MPVLVFVGAMSVVAGVLITAAGLISGTDHLTVAGPAALLCTGTAAATLAVATWVQRHAPGQLAPVVLLGSGVRFVATIAGVVLFRGILVRGGQSPQLFAEWTAVFYTVTLASESALLIRGLTAAGLKARAERDDGPAPTTRP